MLGEPHHTHESELAEHTRINLVFAIVVNDRIRVAEHLSATPLLRSRLYVCTGSGALGGINDRDANRYA